MALHAGFPLTDTCQNQRCYAVLCCLLVHVWLYAYSISVLIPFYNQFLMLYQIEFRKEYFK